MRKWQLFILVSLFCVGGGWRGGSRESSGGLNSWYWGWGFKERAMGGEGSFLPGPDPLGGGVGRTSSGEEKGWNWKGTRNDGPLGWGGSGLQRGVLPNGTERSGEEGAWTSPAEPPDKAPFQCQRWLDSPRAGQVHTLQASPLRPPAPALGRRPSFFGVQ